MKGFVKILEAIIACIILLASLSYFFTFHTQQSGWFDTTLKLEAQDALTVLDKSGFIQDWIRENNESGLKEKGKLDKMIHETADFAVGVYGIPKSEIWIGCNCSETEKEELKKMLRPGTASGSDLERGGAFLLNGRKIELMVKKVNLDHLEGTDVLIFFGYKDLTTHMAEINELLAQGGGIVAIANLTAGQTNDGIFNTIFNLSWNSGGSGSSNSVFNDITDPRNVSYKIADYFVSVPFRVNTSYDHEGEFYIHGNEHTIETYYNSTGEYAIFNTKYYEEGDIIVVDDVPVKVVRINANVSLPEFESVDLSIINASYEFYGLPWDATTNKIAKDKKTVLVSDELSSVKANYYITKYGKGRTVWIPEYEKKYTDINQLLKASILWASGEEFIIDDKTLPKQYMEVSRIINDNGVSYRVSLLIWRIFY